jgi:hypothetical protein
LPSLIDPLLAILSSNAGIHVLCALPFRVPAVSQPAVGLLSHFSSAHLCLLGQSPVGDLRLPRRCSWGVYLSPGLPILLSHHLPFRWKEQRASEIGQIVVTEAGETALCLSDKCCHLNRDAHGSLPFERRWFNRRPCLCLFRLWFPRSRYPRNSSQIPHPHDF